MHIPSPNSPYSDKTQIFISAENWYSLEYPRMWEMEIIDNIPAFFDPIWGKGAVQVFAALLGSHADYATATAEHPFLRGTSLSEKMELFLEEQGVSCVVEDLLLIEHNSIKPQTWLIAYEYNINGRFYMACMYQKSNHFLLTLYNCEGFPSEEEAKAISHILKSVKIHD